MPGLNTTFPKYHQVVSSTLDSSNASNVSQLAIADAKDRSALNQACLEMSIQMEEVLTDDGNSLQNEEKRCVKKSVS